MLRFIELGSAPPDEDCAQTGSHGYERKARAECLRYIALLRRKLGAEPRGARLITKSFPHDFGVYYEVVCWYNPESEEAAAYAHACETDGPSDWEDRTPHDWRKSGTREQRTQPPPSVSPKNINTAKPF